MDFSHLALIAVIVIGLVWFAVKHGHSNGFNAGIQKAKTDAQALGAAVETDARKAAATVGGMSVSGALRDAVQFVEHPLQSIEHELAEHHFAAIKASLAALGDDAQELAAIGEAQAKIAAQQALIDFRAGLRAQASALVAQAGAIVVGMPAQSAAPTASPAPAATA